MVGSAPWKGFDRVAVLKLKLGVENPTIYTGVASGSLESVSSVNSQAYFDPLLIFSFPQVSNYNYTLVPKEIGAMFPSDSDVGKDESLSPEETKFCSVIGWGGARSLELEYAADCTTPHGCSLFEFLPRFLSLTSTQCAEGEMKAMFVAKFQNYSYYNDQEFGVGSTLIGELQWDDEKKRVIGVACPILNPSQHFGDAVGDCEVRLSLRFPSILTIKNDARIVGQIWSSKPELRKMSVAKHDDQWEVALALQGQRYEYTELDRARKSCTAKKPAKKGDEYPDGQAYDMRFDMNIKNHHGEELGWAYATPSWVGNDSYQGGHVLLSDALESDAESVESIDSAENHNPTEMSYKISIRPFYHYNSSNNISSPNLNWPVNPQGVVDITAEGLYDARNGHLCMVGCRKLVQNSTHSFIDCDIVVELEFPPLDRKRGGLIKGSITSTRGNMDPLHFDSLMVQSASQYVEVAEGSIWRMDLEITMVLISNTLACIFVGLQIFHVKRNPEVPSFISLVMLVILSVGHMIPLVLNFEAVFLGNRYKQTLELGSGGRLEANEVAVRVITMVALLLQLRLLQVVWVAKQSDGSGKSWWSGEKKAGSVSLALYILGGMLSLVVNWMRKTYVGRRYSVWGDLRSYAGLILDGFLVPQILFNIFRGASPQKPLSHPFYIGMSSVRLVPHAYNQYRAHNYPKFDLNATYYYANPAADLYSTAWDIIIPFGVIVFAVVVFVQQRHGGRCILPQRLRGLEMYEKVATDDTQ